MISQRTNLQPGSIAWMVLLPALALSGCGGDATRPGLDSRTVPPRFLLEWDGRREGALRNPTGIAEDAAGNVYVLDSGHVHRFTREGGFLGTWSARGTDRFEPSMMIGDPRHNWLILAHSTRIRVFSTGGDQLVEWGGAGDGPGEFGDISYLSVDEDGNVYALDTGRDRIQKYGPDGVFLTAWGELGVDDGEFVDPRAIVADGRGSVFVAEGYQGEFLPAGSGNRMFLRAGPAEGLLDQEGVEVHRFGVNGEFRARWPVRIPESEFVSIRSMAVDSEGNLLLGQSYSGIARFTPDGRFLGQWSPASGGESSISLAQMVTGDAGETLALLGNAVFRFSAQNSLMNEIGHGLGLPGELYYPEAVLADQAGDVYVLDRGRDRIYKYGPTGSFLMEFSDPVRQDLRAGTMALDSQGGLVVATQRGEIIRFDHRGVIRERHDVGASGYGRAAIDGENGFLYREADSGLRGEEWIEQYSWDGVLLRTLQVPLVRGLSYVADIAVDPSGRLWVADGGQLRIFQISMEGDLLSSWDLLSTLEDPIFPGIVAFGPGGVVEVVDLIDDVVHRFTSGGRLLVSWPLDEVSRLESMAVDAAGHVYIADSQAGKVLKYGP